MSRSKNVSNQVSFNNVGNIANASVGNSALANGVESAAVIKINSADVATTYQLSKKPSQDCATRCASLAWLVWTIWSP